MSLKSDLQALLNRVSALVNTLPDDDPPPPPPPPGNLQPAMAPANPDCEPDVLACFAGGGKLGPFSQSPVTGQMVQDSMNKLTLIFNGDGHDVPLLVRGDDWEAGEPTNMKEAIDRLAAAYKAQTGSVVPNLP